ncbi:MAG: putative ABC transporter permease [Clostridiales bacterium]|nr:putative ABC transporter permease [Clostridiales bacterium]
MYRSKFIHTLREGLFVFAFGGVIYSLTEIAYRGFTHWTMTLTGGLAFLMLYVINIKLASANIFVKSLVGCLIITSIEFFVGIVANRMFGLKVWDYSGNRFNLCGQVCPRFSCIWFLLCIPGVTICRFIKANLFEYVAEIKKEQGS